MTNLSKLMTNRKFYWMAIISIIASAILTYNISIASTKEVTKFVNNLSQNVMSIMKQPHLTDSQKQDQLSAIFLKVVDTDWIGKFVLGRYWNTATPETQQEYLKLYRKYLIGIYVPNFQKYTSQKLQISNVSETAKNEYLVHTLMVDPATNNSIKIDYRIIKKSNSSEFVIFDIVGEGISLIATQRSEFSTVINRSGLTALIEDLKRKT